jgi:hypothetical protein
MRHSTVSTAGAQPYSAELILYVEITRGDKPRIWGQVSWQLVTTCTKCCNTRFKPGLKWNRIVREAGTVRNPIVINMDIVSLLLCW